VTLPIPEAFGQAVLSLEPITSTTRHELPDDGDEARIVMTAETTIDGAPVRVSNTHLSTHEAHLSTHEEGRDKQILAAFKVAEGSDVPAVFAGDFNTGPSEVTLAARKHGFEQGDGDAPSACGDRDPPKWDLDHIYVRGAEAFRPTVGKCAPSDHAPVGVEVSLPRAGALQNKSDD
jgi:endonuclease/exonuclease/phosphatase family metal-dependent hydrolase